MASSKNKKTAILFFAVFIGMVGLTYASVPLYKLFCQMTGLDGTVRKAESLPAAIGERIVTVRFNTDVDPNLSWAFQPIEREVKIKTGEVGKMTFIAVNKGKEPLVGTSTFNVTPEKAGAYFNKVQCFCFEEHMLQPGERAEFPVTFFVDPAIEQDKNLEDVQTITLSYTFFKARNQDLIKTSGGATTKPYN